MFPAFPTDTQSIAASAQRSSAKTNAREQPVSEQNKWTGVVARKEDLRCNFMKIRPGRKVNVFVLRQKAQAEPHLADTDALF